MADTSMLRDRLGSVQEMEDVDISALSDDQVRSLYATLSGEESPAERQRAIDAIVSDSQYTMDEEAVMADPEFRDRVGASNDIRDVVEDMLAREAIDADVDELTDEQVTALYLELTSGDVTDATTIEAIIQ
jgi:hypothetical protein